MRSEILFDTSLKIPHSKLYGIYMDYDYKENKIMSAATDKRGLKRVCTDCGNRFYDFNKRPIICSTCETEFTGVEKIKVRRGRVAAKAETEVEVKAEGQVTEKTAKEAANDADTDEEEEEISGIEVVSLDDLEIVEASGDDDNAAGVKIDLDNDNDLDDLDVDLEPDGPDNLEPDADDDTKE